MISFFGLLIYTLGETEGARGEGEGTETGFFVSL